MNGQAFAARAVHGGDLSPRGEKQFTPGGVLAAASAGGQRRRVAGAGGGGAAGRRRRCGRRVRARSRPCPVIPNQLRQCEWVVYAERPLAGPQAVLAYLSRCTHRVAISNSRLIALDEHGATFK